MLRIAQNPTDPCQVFSTVITINLLSMHANTAPEKVLPGKDVVVRLVREVRGCLSSAGRAADS
ncbi:hypothetical protein ACFL4U_00325 [Candidatus Neomarinimicrobiota bacterium]